MKSLLYNAMDTLTCTFQNWNADSPTYTFEQLLDLSREFQKYSAFAGSLLPMVAKHGSFHMYPNLCAVFMPVFVQTRKLEIVDANKEVMYHFITKTDLFDSETLEKVTELNFNKILFTPDHSFLKKFPRLKILVIDCRLDDRFVGSIVDHFPELRVLDCCSRDVYCSLLTDHGLDYLAQLHKLKCLLLDNRYDGLTCDDEDIFMVPTRYSARGVACLIRRLPELERFVCPGFIMKDALLELHKSEIMLPTIKSIYLAGEHVHVENMPAINEVFPALERICVSVYKQDEKETVQTLSSLPHIKQLHLLLEWPLTDFDIIGTKLTFLELFHDKFQFNNLLICGVYCPNVKVLSLRGNHLDISPSIMNGVDLFKPVFFNSLETLIYGINDIRGVFMFLHQYSTLRHFYYIRAWHDNYEEEDLDDIPTPAALIKTLEPGCKMWSLLETFCMSHLIYDPHRVERLAEALPSLKLILLNTRLPSIHVSSRGQQVSVCDALDGSLPSRLPPMAFGFPATSYSLL